MTALVEDNRPEANFRPIFKNLRSSLAIVSDDIAQGLFQITHNGFALLGLVVVFATLALMVRTDLREAGELKLMSWLQERRDAVISFREPDLKEPAPAAVKTEKPVVASAPKALSRQQAAVASWISKKYSVAQEPVGVLVAEAFDVGLKAKLDPTLILAIMAIESGFNPFAQSPVGAQGLMQVMTQIHHDKYQSFGGKLAAFDPVSNLRVGVKVLQECISRAGSIEGGLKYYVGAANLPSDGGYAVKVLAEHARLRAVVGGKSPPTTRVMVAAPAQTDSPATRKTTVLHQNAPARDDSDRVALLGES
ncbi:MAG: transglycosylase SLT domain-containing protein [Polaromonas sp.]